MKKLLLYAGFACVLVWAALLYVGVEAAIIAIVAIVVVWVISQMFETTPIARPVNKDMYLKFLNEMDKDETRKLSTRCAHNTRLSKHPYTDIAYWHAVDDDQFE